MSGPRTVECEQGSESWFRARMGIPTASEFGTVMAKGKTAGAVSETRRKYLYRLVGEIITGQPAESFTNAHMERGKAMEAEARAMYAFQYDVEPEIVGFIVNGRKGCSPDSLIGAKGGLEVKTKLAGIMVECILRDDPPPEHRAQLQGFLLVCEREWVDLACYWPGMPLVVHRVTRDNGYLANLTGEINRFNDELDATVEKVRRYGQPHAVAA